MTGRGAYTWGPWLITSPIRLGDQAIRTIYHITLPATDPHSLSQDQAYFKLLEDGVESTIRFHDYAELYRRPGLYEQLFYQRLKCTSPKKISEILAKVLRDNRVEMGELRVLDLGAGNGMVGEQLQGLGVARIIGVDICPAAREACLRDRPGVYDDYCVQDLSDKSPEAQERLSAWQPDCLVSVAALGFGDIPPTAFAHAFELIPVGGWVAFNIKETFLLAADRSGFSELIKTMMMSDTLEVHHLERYRHRVSIDGRGLFYYALIGRKEKDIDPRELDRLVLAG